LLQAAGGDNFVLDNIFALIDDEYICADLSSRF
jgi:hypothetical protein